MTTQTTPASEARDALVADLEYRARYLRQPEIRDFRIGDLADDIAFELDRAAAAVQAVAARVPMTVDQIVQIARETQTAEPGRDGYVLPVTFARAIEAAHGITPKKKEKE